MLNYFGVGLDAKIALDFQNRRDKYPFLFKSRVINQSTVSFANRTLLVCKQAYIY